MSEKEVDIGILRAMEKLDKDLEIMNQKKIIIHKKKNAIQIIPELSMDEKAKEKTKEFNKVLFDEVKFKAALGVGLFVITLVVVSSLSTTKQFSFIEHFIVVLCCVGVVASKR